LRSEIATDVPELPISTPTTARNSTRVETGGVDVNEEDSDDDEDILLSSLLLFGCFCVLSLVVLSLRCFDVNDEEKKKSGKEKDGRKKW